MANGTVVVVGGTQGLGRELAKAYADDGRDVVITGREQGGAEAAAGEIGAAGGLGFDLAEPHSIADALAGVGDVQYLVLAAIERDVNKVREYDIDAALRLVTLKLVGYTQVIHALASRMGEDSAILIFGGLARDRPYPGSTTVTTVNGGVTGLVRTLVTELAPPGGKLVDRHGARTLAGIALAVIAAGNVVALITASFPLGILGRLIAGLGTGIGFIAGSDYVRATVGSATAQGLYGASAVGGGGV